ncbi:MAG TPA: protein kinase [Thermoanaerobaculia bacterium]|nr:protein kinase [Thermoanaerobaculia bacterium]
MNVAKGVSLGPYEILSPIGSGGMGEVWRARDRRIGRDVAIKVLPGTFGASDELVLRFQQEARAAGALNHPGLVTIFDVGTNEGSPYIVMELLDGETMREAIDRAVPHPLPLRKTIDYAIQIAEALAVAHEKGIIHRDLKPENLFVTTDRRVKILDFGLAKLAEAKDSDGKQRTGRHLTSAGIVVGTPGYMSPEQVRALPLDHRTDIFSLGSCLYEMLCGRPSFEKDSAIETMHAVLSVEPVPLSTLVPDLPASVEAIVRHCLEKDPRERFQSARDLAFQLRMLPQIQGSIADSRRVQPAAPRRFPWRVGIAALLATLVAAGSFAVYRISNTEAELVSPRSFRQLTFDDGLEVFPALAPDGKSFVYVSAESGNRDIYLQRTDGRTPINLTSDSPDDDSEPVFSPDGSQIAFRSERAGGGIFVMGVTGESVRRLTDFGHNPSFSPDGTRIVVATRPIELQPHVHGVNSQLWIVDTRSEAKKPLVQPGVGGPDFGRGCDAVQPSWSPGGKRIAFWGVSTWHGQRDLWTIDPDAAQPKTTVVRVTSDAALDWNPVWSPDGKYLYYGSDRDGTLNLWRIPMDEETGTPTGRPEPLALPASVSGNFAFSRQGELAFTTVTRSYRLLSMPFDPATATTGPPRPLFGGSQEILTFERSPDGQSIAFTTSGNAQEDLFIANADGTRVRQLTNDAARDRGVTWSPDGKTLYFYSNRQDAYHIWSIRADGSGLTRVTTDADLRQLGARNIYTPHLSPDGRTIAAQTDDVGVLVHLGRSGPGRIEVMGGGFIGGRWSPDGRRIAGGMKNTPSAVSSGIAVYSPSARRAERLSEQGVAPHWLPDGKRLAFFARDHIGIIDVDSRRILRAPFAPLEGVTPHSLAVSPRLAADASTVFMRQTLEQGDIWMVRFEAGR